MFSLSSLSRTALPLRRNITTATTLREAALQPAYLQTLDLSRSEALMCVTMMCEKVGMACICKLARWLEQTGPQLRELSHLNLAGNNLVALPNPVFALKGLTHLNVSGNALTEIPTDIKGLEN